MQSFQIRNVADIETIQAQHTLQERLKISNTYDLIQQGCSYDPQADALSFIASGDSFDQPITISYQTLLENIRQCANLLHSLGIGANDVVSYLLPNLIETHSVLWGAEAVGIVNPINPLLEPETIKGICVSANTRVLVALGDPQIWDKVLAIKDKIPTLKTILCISEHVEERDNILNFHIQVSKHNAQQLDFSRTIDPDDISSLYHTGGTTGTPKLAKRTHYNEVSMAWMLNASANVQNRFTILCGLPMFHVNATTVTG